MDNIIFYREWLPLDKKDFRILAMLADKGKFQGNLSDLCRYFSLDPQQRNRNQLRGSIQRLRDQGLIVCEISGRTYSLHAIPKDKKIKIPGQWFKTLRRHDYTSEAVSWEATLKVLLWIIDNRSPVITNQRIANDLAISVSTVGYAKNVLEREYNAIVRKRVSEKIGKNTFFTVGQELTACAWWS